MPYALGIDLGTTNSVASVFRRGANETLAIDGRSALPSVVSFRDDGAVLVGQPAKARLLVDPERTVASAKRYMGDAAKRYRIGDRLLTPVDVASLVLKRLVEGARAALTEEVWDAVITVPAYFTEAQREDTKRAGEEAGLNVLRLIPEPTAAAIAYALDKEKDQTIMVYDLGGGTFDVSILEVNNNKFQVKAVGGDSRLGGDDFDQAVMTWANEQFRSQTGIDILGTDTREAKAAQQRLKEAAEVAKIDLASADHANISVPDCMGYPLDLELSLSQFNDLISPLLQRTVDCMQSVLRDAQITPDDIARVILVGGSTKASAVREVVAREIKDPFTSDRVDEVVSHGAAVVAANLFLPEEDNVPIEISDVTGHSLGIAMLEGGKGPVFQAVIARQSAYPCRRGILGYTVRGRQEFVIMKVFRGEDSDPQRNTHLGELSLPISPPQPDSVPIAAIFELDADGIIHFTAVLLPADSATQRIIRWANEHNGALDVPAVDSMIQSKQVDPKTVNIKS